MYLCNSNSLRFVLSEKFRILMDDTDMFILYDLLQDKDRMLTFQIVKGIFVECKEKMCIIQISNKV